MDKPVCLVRNLRKSALSGHVSEIDAIATGGYYLSPDSTGCFDASAAHDLCVSCVNCGSVVVNPGDTAQLICCSDCGQNEFHVVQTKPFPPPRHEPHVVPQSYSPRPSDDDPSDNCVASPWARWAARILDFHMSIILGFIPYCVVFGVGCSSEKPVVCIVALLGLELWGIPTGFALETLCYYFTGWTLGKWLFAVKIRHQDGRRLSFVEYFKRCLCCFVDGMGLYLPIVSLITGVIQYNHIRAGKCASYDEGNNVKIVRVNHGTARVVFGILAIAFVCFIICAMMSVGLRLGEVSESSAASETKPKKETDPNSKLVVTPKKFQWPEFTSTEKRYYPKSIEIIEDARRKWEAGDSSERTKLMAQSTPYTLSMRLFGRRNAGADEGARYAQSTDTETVAASEWAQDPAFYRQGHGPNAGLTPLARQVLEQVGRRGLYWDDKPIDNPSPWTSKFLDNLRRRWKEQPVIRLFYPNSYSPYDWDGRPDYHAIKKILGTDTGFGTLPVATE